MHIIIQKELLAKFILEMTNEGLVNNQFIELQSCKEPNSPDFVLQTVVTYCSVVKNLFSLLSNELNQPEVDFARVELHAKDLIERSKSIGVESFKARCDLLSSCAQVRDISDCAQALLEAKREFTKLRTKFETFVQMERNIIETANGNVTRTLP